MIKNFKDGEAEKIFKAQPSRKLPQDIQQRDHNKLTILDSVISFEELRIPPSNFLEKLKGNRKDEWSMRINNQWRICFKFDYKEASAFDVSIEDYH